MFSATFLNLMAVLSVEVKEALEQIDTDAILEVLRDRTRDFMENGAFAKEREFCRNSINERVQFGFKPSLLGLVPADEVDDISDASIEQLEEELSCRLKQPVGKLRFEKELQERVSNPIARRDLICDIFGLPHTASIATILQSVNEALV